MTATLIADDPEPRNYPVACIVAQWFTHYATAAKTIRDMTRNKYSEFIKYGFMLLREALKSL